MVRGYFSKPDNHGDIKNHLGLHRYFSQCGIVTIKLHSSDAMNVIQECVKIFKAILLYIQKLKMHCSFLI